MKKGLLILLIIGIIASLVYIQRLRSDNSLTPQPGEINAYPTTSNSQIDQTSTTEDLNLEIIAPKNNITVSNSSLTIKGKTAPMVDVFVNEVETKADAQGNFSAKLVLDEGENIIVIFANDAEGNSVESELSITYEP